MSPLRPVFTNLNGDSSWLISLPQPAGGYFHLLLDPWLGGPAIITSSWLSHITHIEQENGAESRIDAVIVSHPFSDHTHKDTLIQLASTVTVYATRETAAVVRSWNYFDTVPHPALYYGMVIAYTTPEKTTEAVIYSPHGIEPPFVQPLVEEASFTTLALLHGIDDQSTLGVPQLGVENGLRLEALTGARYWLRTHSPLLDFRGLIGWFYRIFPRTLDDGLEQEERETGYKRARPNYVEIANGESVVSK
ncbi:MBL fold metallo-hydrolase [Aspergillus brunneoviolaceus CBS 621.78]|uniref:Uncharacterized protein n=2 Tax=Aspergillus brunneoviolaceus CBS 621.78 TaxID=1450534 RepID=A0ACD1GKB9_9EURO|nr:hypothetical protein BO95DRAFT_459945 [Aspergillus brunneoviolaceus CBS 621.78]XP_025446099.1 hypothetical protein BO95DRAFT_459969 [Aspergillus brunneoviolaceus CBS 621.78]RAH49553.1 hypothetical protein BO95DRAFT_459945 [Aspergillus brunneoviolaceus CBS 621.78]RAH49578.1 hypothetical protein BO95DRAFT_459969 [Aspergillus brunneoviolaceus CBS 621.78]